MPKWVVAILIILISFVAYIDSKKIGLINGLEISQIKFPKFNSIEFSSIENCKEYIIKNSGNSNKLDVGILLCTMQFGSEYYKPNSEGIKLSKCIFEDFKNILDDASGTRIVTRCNENFQVKDVGFMLLDEFSESKRIERANESIRREIENRTNEIITIERNDGPMIFSNGGTLKPCIKVGVIIDCP